MIHIRSEGQAIRTGLNFYPLKSNLIGFVFKVGTFYSTIRYNRATKKWVFR